MSGIDTVSAGAQLVLWLLFAAAVSLPVAFAEPAPQPTIAVPIFDAHLHYNRDQWSVYSVDDLLALMDRAGVQRAFVSSTPDEGTLMLHDRAPDRIVPGLRPYRTPADQYSWTRDASIVDYAQQELGLDGVVFKGIGELHLNPGEARLAAPRALADLGAAQNLVLHAHTDATGVEELLQLRPDIRVLWAHAGMNASPATVGRLLDLHPNLWVELALRVDVAPNGRLDPAWAAVFERHPDRFMVGTDTWVVSQWTNLPSLMARVRGWLAQLRPEVAEQIAHANAEQVLGS